LKFAVILLLALGSHAVAKKKLSPFQAKIDQCVASKFLVSKIDNNKKLYAALVENFSLQGSETTFREVLYKEQGETRKLRFEDGVVRIFRVADDESLSKLSTEELSYKPSGSGVRYRAQTPEARINELLAKAEIKSDFAKTTEYRSKQVLLNIVWTDNQIKEISADLPGGKRLECQRKQASDICECRSN
jgi:hypothetical protein